METFDERKVIKVISLRRRFLVVVCESGSPTSYSYFLITSYECVISR